MSGDQVCNNCGAPMHAGARECEYCSPTGGKALDPAVLAAALGGAGKDIESALLALGEKLAESFPDVTELDTSGGLLSAKHIKTLAVTLDPHVYRVRRDGKHVVAERVKVVRGVALKTTKLEFAQWIDELSADLAAMAKQTAASRAALARWVRGA